MTGEELEKLLANDRLGSISEAALFERVVKWGRGQLIATASAADGGVLSSPIQDSKDGKADPRLKKILSNLLKHIRYGY
jgi:hypothetical protein